jgi:hypothetical protein
MRPMCEKLAYNRGAITPDLEIFVSNYKRVLRQEIYSRIALSRASYDQKKLELGEDGLAAVIEAKMGSSDFALLENDYPYDNLIPAGSSLRHFCLWSKDEDRLTVEAINGQIEASFSNKPAFVFRHGGNLISIRKIPHVHIIVDAKG